MSSLSLDSSWREICSSYCGLLNPFTLPKKVVVTLHSHVDDLILRGTYACAGAAVWNVGRVVSNYIYENQLKDLAVIFQEPYIEMKQRWKDSPTLLNTGMIGTVWSYIVWGGNPPKPEEKEEIQAPQTDCFFNERIQSVVDELTLGMDENAKAGRPLQNAIFYGPPGVGKSMVLEKIGMKFNGNYMLFTASALRNAIQSGTHLWELQKIFKKMERSEYPTVLIIDECELLFTDRRILRAQGMNSSYDLLESFLKKTGAENKKISIILATNHLDQVDEAILDRMHYKVKIEVPAFKERCAILKEHVKLKFASEIDRDILMGRLEEIADRTGGLSGRTLEKMLNRIATIRDMSPMKRIDSSMIDRVILEVMQEFQEAESALLVKQLQEG